MTIWISHRGVRDGAVVENTAKAFQAAVRRGFKTLETDLRITADHHLVLSHDENFGRLSDNSLSILKQTRSQLSSVRLSDGQRPYFFDEFMADHGAHKWVLDIKPETGAASLRILLKWVQLQMPIDAFSRKASFVVWQASDREFIERAFIGAKIYATKDECWRAGISTLLLAGLGSGIRENKVYSLTHEIFGQSLFRKEIIDRYHQRSAKVLAFLPSNDAECRRAIAAGVDEILSDGSIF